MGVTERDGARRRGGPALRGWQSAQRWSPAGEVESEQRVLADRPVVAATPEGARVLGERYWAEVERFAHGLVRVVRVGDRVELRLLGRRPRLLVLGPPELTVAKGVVACRYGIDGGILARRAGGSLSLSQEGEGEVELRSTISGFFPRLGRGPGPTGALYSHVQSRIHVRVGRRFFAGLTAGGGS